MRAQGVCGGRVGVAGEPPAQRDIGRSVSAPVRWWWRLWRPGGAGVSRHHQNLFRFALLVRRRTARRILCVVCRRQSSKLGLEGTDGAIWRREEIEMLIAAGMSQRTAGISECPFLAQPICLLCLCVYAQGCVIFCTNRASTSHLELAARAVVEARAGEDPRKASRWAVMCAKRRQFEREHAEDLRRSAIFIKYTVGCFSGESILSINRDDVAICRSFAACQPISQSFLPAIS